MAPRCSAIRDSPCHKAQSFPSGQCGTHVRAQASVTSLLPSRFAPSLDAELSQLVGFESDSKHPEIVCRLRSQRPQQHQRMIHRRIFTLWRRPVGYSWLSSFQPRWVGIRPSEPGNGGERRGTTRQMQKFSAGKFHNSSRCNAASATLHSGLMLAARITLPHFSVSSAMSLTNSTAVVGIGSTAKSARRALMAASANTALVS